LSLNIVDDFWSHHDPNFATGLHREYLVDAVAGSGNLLKPFQTLHVCLDALSASSRTTAADCVGRLNEDSFDGSYLDLAVVSLDGMHHIGMLAVFASQIGADDSVRPFHFMGQRLADVMQKGGTFAVSDVQPQFRRHQRGDVGALH
jgi:hypothetical protein